MRLTFRNKALLFILPVLGIVSAIYTYETIKTEKQIMSSEMMKRAGAITTLATKTGELPILSGNPELLRSTIKFLKDNFEVISVAFFDQKMNLLIHEGPKIGMSAPVLSPQSSLSMFEEDTAFVFYAPVFTVRAKEDIDIFHEGGQGRQVRENIGWVKLGFSKAPMEDATRQIVLRGSMLGTIFTAGSSAAIFLLITLFTRPLTILFAAAKELEKGEYPRIEGVKSGDEFGELARAFDRMSRSIEDRESKLLKSEKRIRELFDRVEHAIFRLDKEGRIIGTNRKFDELCGPADRFCDMFVKNPAGNQAGRQEGFRLQKTLSGGLKNVEEKIVGSDGSELIVAMSVYPDLDENAEATGFDGYFVDITEKKKMEEGLVQSQKLESLGMLAGGIAHDFNNILTGVLGYSSLSKSMVTEQDKIYRYLEIIEKSAVRASDLAKQLLGFARKGKYQVSKLNVNALVGELSAFLKETFDRNIVIVIDCEKDLPPVEGDNNQLYQALINLSINARDAMQDGGRLYIKTESCMLPVEKTGDFSSIPPGEYVILNVTDTGAGIAPEVKKKIFEPFYTTKEVGKGTGLGLAMVYGIVKNHGGYITVCSEPGLGTSIRLYLPTTEGFVEEKMTDNAIPARSKKGTILLIDDEEVVRELGKDILEAYDYEVFLGAHGGDGVKIFDENRDRIDLVILDMVMPEKGGRQTFAEILSIRPDAKVLLCSGYGQEQYFYEIFTVGAAGFLQKPFRHTSLLQKVEEAIGK